MKSPWMGHPVAKEMNLLSRTLKELGIIARLLPPGDFLCWLKELLLSAPEVIRQRSLGPVDRSFGESFVFRWRGRNIEINRSDIGIVREIFGHRCYAAYSDISKARNILDLGCNTGLFTIFALLESPYSRILAVDAQRDLVDAAGQNLAQFDTDRVTFDTAIVGDPDSDLIRSLRSDDPALASFDLPGYLHSVGRCDFVKCDIEGAEFSLFRDDLSFLDAVGAMAIEVHPSCGDLHGLESTLRNAGFRLDSMRHGELGYLFCRRS